MRRIFGIILSPIHYIFFGLVLVIFQPVQWFCFNVFGYQAHKRSVDVLNFFLVSTYYLLGNSVSFIDEPKLPKGRQIIFVANHQSLYDIPVMIYFLRKYHPKFVSKIELAKGIPSISYNLRHGGAANIDRKDPRQSMTELSRLGTDMKTKGWSAMIFPEGTRSADGVVRSFQSAGVAMLLKKCPEALIVPVAINNSWKMVRYGKFPLNTFIKMSWTVLAPIDPTGHKADEVVAEAEIAIKKAIGQNEV